MRGLQDRQYGLIGLGTETNQSIATARRRVDRQSAARPIALASLFSMSQWVTRKRSRLDPQLCLENDVQRHSPRQVHQPDAGEELPQANQASAAREDAEARGRLRQVDQ